MFGSDRANINTKASRIIERAHVRHYIYVQFNNINQQHFTNVHICTAKRIQNNARRNIAKD